MVNRTFTHHLRRLAFALGFGGAALFLVIALGADRLLGKDVWIIAPHSPETVELNRALFEPEDRVAEVYGNPLSKPVRVILPSGERLIRPEEDPSIILLKVNKQAGENPLQASTVWFFAKYLAPALTLLGLIGFVFPRSSPARKQADTAR